MRQKKPSQRVHSKETRQRQDINELEDCVFVKETRGNRTKASIGHDAARSSREHREF